MIYGIEQSTDMRDPRTRIKTFENNRLSAAIEWASKGGHLTHPDPDLAANWHHTFRAVYAMPKGWRRPRPQVLRKLAEKSSTPTYPRNTLDELATIVRIEGERMDNPMDQAFKETASG